MNYTDRQSQERLTLAMMKDKVEQNLDLFATRSFSSPLGSVKLVIWFHRPCFQDLLSVGFLLGFIKWRIEERKQLVVYLSLRHHLILIIRPYQCLFQGTSFQSLDSGPWVQLTTLCPVSSDGSNTLQSLLLILLLLVLGLFHQSSINFLCFSITRITTYVN